MTTCAYCGTPLHLEVVDIGAVWVDDTDGDVCWGDDDLHNENEPHTPTTEV